MRNSKTITLNQRLSVTAFELSVGQILELFWLMADFVYPAELELFAKTQQETLLAKVPAVFEFSREADFSKLPNTESQQAIDLFFEVNAAFFKPEKVETGEQHEAIYIPDYTGTDLYQQLSSSVSTLIRLGYQGVLDYPFSFFLQVIESLEAQSGK